MPAALPSSPAPELPPESDNAPLRQRRRRNVFVSAQGVMQDENGKEVQRLFQTFLETFRDPNPPSASSIGSSNTEPQTPFYYINELAEMLAEHKQELLLKFNWGHFAISNASGGDRRFDDLADVIQTNLFRYLPYLCEAVNDTVRDNFPERKLIKKDGRTSKFEISIYNFDVTKSLRELDTKMVAQLSAFSGTITRASEVRPELIKGTFVCQECGALVKDVEQSFKFTEPTSCPNPQCQNTRNWKLQMDGSEFADWQKLRVQEHSEDIPAGSMPRSMDVILRNDCVEQAKPGDKCVFTGMLIVVPDVSNMYSRGSPGRPGGGGPDRSGDGVMGFESMGVREMSYRMMFLASSVLQAGTIEPDDNDDDVVNGMSDEMKQKILDMGYNTPGIYARLAKCIAPNIYGHSDIKKGILLMMFGGVHKETKTGVGLRGDINVCIVGDPSTAKSQFLKYVSRVLPRVVYTSGKASSAAGLTASVVRDPETGDFCIDAGALMLADNGVCCIDEFDKMDDYDQAAIHEAMEQQTITITKAGIQATLNARASILAAANPVFGRYDTSKSLRTNVNISAPIMSRFDLFFVVLDECDGKVDQHVADHILALHQNKETGVQAEFTEEEVRDYLKFARILKPKLTMGAKKLLVKAYTQLRQQDAEERKAYRFTVRQLESMIRLSEARARVGLSDEIKEAHVREAQRLLKKSIISVDAPEMNLEDGQEDEEENAMAVDSQPSQQKGSRTCSFHVYSRISNMIVGHIRNQCKEQQTTRQELEEWYTDFLTDKHSGNENRLAVMSKEVDEFKWIVNRLINIDTILIENKVFASDKDKEGKMVLYVHTNYDPDNIHAGHLGQNPTQPVMPRMGAGTLDTDPAQTQPQEAMDEDLMEAEKAATKSRRKAGDPFEFGDDDL